MSDNDKYVTSKQTWASIARFIPKDKIIWESAYCEGSSGKHWKDLGYEVIHENRDFFKWEPERYDVQITNPPFTRKIEWIERSVSLGKPFIIILPASSLTTVYLRNLFLNSEPHEFQIIIPYKRINFIFVNEHGKADETIKSRSSFDCLFYAYRMNLPRDVVFLGDGGQINE